MAATTFMLPTPATPAFEPVQLKSAEEYRREMIIEYAFKTYQYIITPEEADEIVYEGLWGDVDEFVQYMWDVNFGAPTPDSTNVEFPDGLKIFTSEELDFIDSSPHEIAEEESGAMAEDNGHVGEDVDSEVEIHLEPDLSLVVVTLRGLIEEIFTCEDEDEESLPPYTPNSPPSYTSLFPEETPKYILPMAVEVAPTVEAADPVSCEIETSSTSNEGKKGAFSTIGARLDEKVLKTKRKISRKIKAISPKKILRRVCNTY